MFTIRPIDPNSLSEIETVATRMRDTLIEVLGEDRGAQMYTLEWLIDRVRFHLDRDRCTGEVFLATNSSGDILGHTIVRLDQEENSNLIGLFSTFYISPNHRQMGIGRAFFSAGEQWFCQHGMALAVTYTHPTNIGLRTLAEKIGYRCDPINEDFVRLSKPI